MQTAFVAICTKTYTYGTREPQYYLPRNYSRSPGLGIIAGMEFYSRYSFSDKGTEVLLGACGNTVAAI